MHPWRHLAVATMACVTVALAALTAATVGLQSMGNKAVTPPRVTPILDPTDLPRLGFDQLRYQGAFRLPAGDAAGGTFASGGAPMTFNPDGPSLFIGARSGRIAEVSIPVPVATRDIAAMPVASIIQPFSDPAEGRLKEVASDGVGLSGLLVYRGRLYGTASIYYDANNEQQRSHFSRPLKLADHGATPMARVWKSGRTGFVAGYMALVPPEWQTKLGGPAITGQCCIPIVTRTSWGPSAFAWDPAQLAGSDKIDATPLLYYDSEHPTLGPWEGANPSYGGTIEMGGVALIAGTRTALFVGRNGLGEFCYGNGTGDRALVGTRGSDHEKYCYDPVNSAKSQHAYPYRYQMWAYDLNDWAAVKAGKKDPWEIKPYAVWPFEFPTPEPHVRIAGIAYDPQRQLLYISQFEADRDGYDYRPLIHVYRVS